MLPSSCARRVLSVLGWCHMWRLYAVVFVFFDVEQFWDHKKKGKQGLIDLLVVALW